ncbi:MAG: hypothetical protein H7263_11610 [Candidatus Sericytochromatia bacterium]|nr:hypothetical protein [Candidatus Sericytochromatia bacterium]
MNILFLIIGPVSFREANFTRNFIKQLNGQDHDIRIMSENYTYTYLDLTKNVKFRSMTDNFDEDQFLDYLENCEFDLIVAINFELLLFDDTNLAFKKSYFSSVDIPIIFLMNNNNLLFKNKTAYLLSAPNKKLQLKSDFSLVKSCPPYIPDMDEQDNKIETFYWKNLEQFAFLNREEAREKLRKNIKVNDGSKIVTLLLDVEQMFVSRTKGLNYHYVVLLQCLYKYISNLDIECNIILNISQISIEQNNPKVKMFFFGYLKDEDYEQILRASDIIFTESIASTTLIDSANMKIPVINLKNTLKFEESEDDEGTFIDILYNFQELTDFANGRVEELLTNCPDSIFPYYAFPNPAKVNFPDTKVFGNYIFTFAELFDEKGTTSLIKDLLLNNEVRSEEVYRIEQYLALRADALEAQEILESLQEE